MGWANILALSLGAIGLLLTFIDRRRQAGDVSGDWLARAADELNSQVLGRESLALKRLLDTGRAGSVAANIGFAERLLVFAQPGTGRSGLLDGVGPFYRQHADGGRLVILGEPGSGKTVLALQLLVQQAEARQNVADANGRAVQPVPVRASLPTWNTDVPFADWLGRRLVADYGMRDQDAAALASNRRVLPVLDGLDEMDPPGQPPHRAKAAVAALNEYVAGENGAPLVLTCRHDEYVALGHPLRPATEVVIQPLNADQIRDYARREIGPGATLAEWDHWEQLLDRLDGPAYAGLLQALDTPWRLTLAVSYSRGGGDPTALLRTPQEGAGSTSDVYADRVADLLLGQFIPGRAQSVGSGRYTSAQATGWLQAVAAHLAWQQDNGMSGTDIVLHQWWYIAGQERVRRWHAHLNAALTFTLALLLGVAVNGGSVTATAANVQYYLNEFPALPTQYLVAGISIVGGLFVAPVLAWRSGRSGDAQPTEVNLQQVRTFHGRRNLLLGFAIGVPNVFFAWFVAWVSGGTPAEAVALAVAFGLVISLYIGLDPIGASELNPRDPLRNDLVVWLALGFALGLALGLASVSTSRFVAGLAFGLLIGLLGSLAGKAWMRYIIAVTLMGHGRAQPWRFGRFLTWCNQAGILREAGNAYQFRHVELRDWLRAKSRDRPAGSSNEPSSLKSSDPLSTAGG
ncbi:NACHT domain-containing protein [Actinoplanes sp. NPDC049668]|uniref:NACHT domain-containing protein n=1 Tax=Actinoplanes sp. NPDC049668 TaxID=3363904 RepID=UPI0037953981